VEAVALLMQRVPASGVDFFIYERKNEVYPHRQPTSFYDDARKLGKMLPGKAFRFGDEDEHHILLYQLDRSYSGPQPDLTLEMLMYGIDESIRGAFERGDAGHVRERLGLADLVSGFLLDDYLFEPSGYSINAIRGDEYWTLHVTPESNGSYVSFETNLRNGEELAPVTGMLLELFQPRSFDVFLFRQREEIQLEPRHYRLRSHVCGDLSCGYQVSFRSFHRPETRPRPPAEILVT
jgi:S-adenosylmethionine decarboxylase